MADIACLEFNKYHERWRRLREEMEHIGVDYLITINLDDILYLTGFIGGTGFLYLSEREIILWSDERHGNRLHRLNLEGEIQVRYTSPRVAPSISDWVATIPDSGGIFAVDPTVAPASLWLALSERFDFRLKACSGIVSKVRARKTEDELESIRGAISISGRAFQETLATKLIAGMTEVEFALHLQQAAYDLGAASMAFTPIVAFGKRSAEPLAYPTNQRIEGNGWLLVDWGTTYNGYASDLTRTVHLGTSSDREINDYLRTVEALEAGVASIKAGVTCAEVDSAIRGRLKKAGLSHLFGHVSGHGIGLSAHEAPIINPQSQWVLESNYVLAIEVGVYRPGRGGIRLEHQVLVAEHGAYVLSNEVNTDLLQIELK